MVESQERKRDEEDSETEKTVCVVLSSVTTIMNALGGKRNVIWTVCEGDERRKRTPQRKTTKKKHQRSRTLKEAYAATSGCLGSHKSTKDNRLRLHRRDMRCASHVIRELGIDEIIRN
jgi:hypothetical protein